MDFSLELISVINLFLIPLISVGLFYKYNKYKFKFNIRFVLIWAICIIMLFMVSKILLQCFCVLFAWENVIYIYQYSLIALISSFIIPIVLILIMKNIRIELQIDEKE